jgi:hypothetical protein
MAQCQGTIVTLKLKGAAELVQVRAVDVRYPDARGGVKAATSCCFVQSLMDHD